MTIIHEHAECVPSCDVDDCPYIHTPAWYVQRGNKTYGPFHSHAEALAKDNELEDAETDRLREHIDELLPNP